MVPRLLRSVAAGSSILLMSDLFHHRGDVGALANTMNKRARHVYDVFGGDYWPPKTPREALLIDAAVGAAVGAGYVFFSWLAPGRGALRGAAYGATFWMFNELNFRTAPSRDRQASVNPRPPLWDSVTLGALLGWLVDR